MVLDELRVGGGVGPAVTDPRAAMLGEAIIGHDGSKRRLFGGFGLRSAGESAWGIVLNVLKSAFFFETFGCARHNPSKLGFCSHLHESSRQAQVSKLP